MSLSRKLNAALRLEPRAAPRNAVTVEGLEAAGAWPGGTAVTEETARHISAVDACIEILGNSMAKLPCYIVNRNTRERVDHDLLRLLNVRPNEAMTASIRKKVLETNRNEGGQSYDWIIRDPRTGAIRELIPVPWRLVEPWLDSGGRLWYTVTHPTTGAPMVLPQSDVCHYKNATRDGFKGISPLRRAGEIISTALAAQTYGRSYYERGGQPSGVLQTDADLGGWAENPDGSILTDPDGSPVSKKENLRRSWEKVHAGPQNSHRIAILDLGLKYTPMSGSNRDAQYIELTEALVKDVARVFGVPLHKLYEGKQSYESNEQNSLEYLTGTLMPIIVQYEEEMTWKLLTETELRRGLEIKINALAEMRGDMQSRAAWYSTMIETGVFSPNDIRALEDMPDVEGGDDRRASLNYVPLADWKRLSEQRNEGSDKQDESESERDRVE